MVKSFHTVTIRDFSLFEQTKDFRYLCRMHLPVSRFYIKRLTALVEQIAAALGSESDKQQELSREKHRIKTIMRIQYLVTLYQAAYNLIVHKTQIDVWRSAIGKPKASDYSNLIDYIEKIQSATGITINPDCWEDDLFSLKEEIDRVTDKFQEAFNQSTPDTGVTFLQIVIGVFSALQMSINEDIRLVTFFELKKQAEDVANRIKSKQDAGQH